MSSPKESTILSTGFVENCGKVQKISTLDKK
jgi:hypothetical protein